MRSQIWLWLSFFIITLVVHWIVDSSDRSLYSYERVSANLHREIDEQYSDLHSFIEDVKSRDFNELISAEYPIRVYENNQLVHWTSQEAAPDPASFRSKRDTLFFNPDTTFIVQHASLQKASGTYEVYSYLRIRNNYSINNRYLHDGFNPAIFGENQVYLEDGSGSVRYKGLILNLNLVSENNRSDLHNLIDALRALFGFGTLIVLLNFVMRKISVGPKIILILSFPILRGLQLFYFEDLFRFRGFLFDPLIFTAGIWNPTPGDLVINAVVVVWTLISLIQVLTKTPGIIRQIKVSKVVSFLVLVLCSLSSAMLSQWLFRMFSLVMENAQFSPDITESLAISSKRLLLFLTVVLLVIGYILLNQLLLRVFNEAITGSKSIIFSTLIGLGLFALIPGNHKIVVLVIHYCGWILLIGPRLLRMKRRLRRNSFYFLITFSLMISVLWATAIYKYDERNEAVEKERFVNNLLVGNDLQGEFHIDKALIQIKNDPFLRTRFLNTLLATRNIESRVTQYLSYYLEKYDVQVYMYGSDGQPFGFTDEFSHQYWIDSFALDKYKSSYPDIYFIPDIINGRHKYISIARLGSDEEPIGYFVLEFTLKKYVSRSVFPSLLVENAPLNDNSEYEYAFFGDGQLLYSQGEYPFELLFQSIEEDAKSGIVETDGYHVFFQLLDGGSAILVVSEEYEWNSIFANVSFLFVISLIPIGLIPFFSRQRILGNSLAEKIQWYSGLTFTVPILIISLGILNVLNESYKVEIDRNYEKRARNIAEFIVEDTERFQENEINRDDYGIKIEDIASVSQTDLIIYDRQGKLLGSNREEVFQQNLIAPLINPKAKSFLAQNPFQSLVLEERIGELDYKTVYTGIFSYTDGEYLGTLAVPFFDFKNHLNRQQVEVFNNIIILFTIIFIITVSIGNYGVNELVRPIKMISERLRNVSYVEDSSEPLRYGGRDEIGLLVKEYNSMMSKLSQSREELARVQKETAWKEIARQVAHEIKNPLTPMRLKIQQMQRNYDRQSSEYKTLNSLLTQVDALASTADSFSAFAKMPAPQNEVFDFSALVGEIVNLHEGDDASINADITENLNVYSDPKLLSQILNNLFLNAIQSIDKEEKKIDIKLIKSGSKIEFSISDNGEGIPEELHEKIFLPYFSTKETGSGIGLALAKKGIEQGGGNIWFETESGKGTTFFITYPSA